MDARELDAYHCARNAPVAQLDRVLPSEGRGRGFESRLVRHTNQALTLNCHDSNIHHDSSVTAARIEKPRMTRSTRGFFVLTENLSQSANTQPIRVLSILLFLAVDILGHFMEYSVIVAGTGFEGRAGRIRLAVKPGMPVRLVPEPNNQYDENAIAVYIDVRSWFTLFMKTEVQIGYIKRDKAAFFTRKTQEGGRILSAKVKSMHTDREHPRVSLKVLTDW